MTGSGSGSGVAIAVGVAVAGAAGALARYGVSLLYGSRAVEATAGFPWPTFAINVLGCFLLGVVLSFGPVAGWPRGVVVTVAVGFLGAFTTFSTFGYETQALLRGGRGGVALAYVAASVVVGVAAAWGGALLGRAWAGAA